jgi:RNA polymerase sigma-70 factor, ECF subfamily
MIDGENKLIKDAIRGEASAFGVLYRHYQPKIYRFIYLKVSRREEAEDLTHEVFVKAWHNMPSYESRGFPFGSWLYRIARNMVIDHYRTRKDTTPLEATEEAVLATQTLHADLETKLAVENVRGVLTKLKSEHQEVIVLKYLEDMTNREIAGVLEKSEGAVKLLHNRALKALRALLI